MPPGRPTKPIGSVKFTRRGRWLIKIGDKEWVDMARYYLEVHLDRVLRPGEQVKFKDGNPHNCAVKNLEIWELQRTWTYTPA